MGKDAGDVAAHVAIGELGPTISKLAAFFTEHDTLRTVLDLARTEVKFLENRQDVSLETKRKTTAASLKQQLLELGKLVADVILNLAIEIAVAELRTLVVTELAG